MSRRAITVDHLLRHTAGLALGSSLQASLGVGAGAGQPDEVHGIGHGRICREHRHSQSPPGSAWNYHDGNTVILSHLIRNATGGRPADVMRFARQELFAPLGMRNVTIEFDASGNPEGSSQMLASARDWARFGHALSQ